MKKIIGLHSSVSSTTKTGVVIFGSQVITNLTYASTPLHSCPPYREKDTPVIVVVTPAASVVETGYKAEISSGIYSLSVRALHSAASFPGVDL